MRAGEKNGRAKLTWALVEYWRERYQREREPRRNLIRNASQPTGYLSTQMVADFLGIAQRTAWLMLNGKTWRKKALVLVALVPFLTGCEGLKRLTEGATSTPAAEGPGADYTVSGTTAENFQFVAVRAADSDLTIRVKRQNEDWTDCDQFEVWKTTVGVGGGGIRFMYRNLYVNGVTRPVAPAGTAYEIRSVRRS